VIVNNLTLEMAISASHLDGFIPITTVYSRVAVARDRGTAYNVLKLREVQEIRRRGIAIDDRDNPVGDNSHIGSSSRCDLTISPVTMVGSTTTNEESTATTTGDGSSSKKSKNQVLRKPPRHAQRHVLRLRLRQQDRKCYALHGCFQRGNQPGCYHCDRNNTF
jgi:hypothetical protein